MIISKLKYFILEDFTKHATNARANGENIITINQNPLLPDRHLHHPYPKLKRQLELRLAHKDSRCKSMQ
jgi:hypothetical protein